MLDLEAKYEVVTYSIGDTKAGTKMGKLQLKNIETGCVLNCVLWEETLNRLDFKLFKPGNVLSVLSGSFNEKYNNCIISNLALLEEARSGLEPEEQEAHFNYIKSFVDKFKNEELKDYIISLMDSYKDKLKTAPAAKMHHHNYIGGLIQHIVECIDFANLICEQMTYKINRENVIGACILHDFGKIFEYTIDLETGFIDYDEQFKKNWFTHSQWGYSNCITRGFIEIARMIASHHARVEWGAIVDLGEKNLEPLMYLIHHIDDLSAKFGKISVNDL